MLRIRAAAVLALGLAACREDSPDLVALSACGATADPLLTLALPADRALADGTTLTLISLHIPRAVVSPRKIGVASTSGLFTSAEVVADQCGLATATLKSPREVGPAFVSASYAGVARVVDTLDFVRAWPERILVSTDLPNNSAATPVTVQVRLLRVFGLVTGNVLVSIAAATLDGQPIGTVQPTVLLVDTTGAGSIKFAVSDTSFRGSIRITAAVDTVGGTVSASTTFAITK